MRRLDPSPARPPSGEVAAIVLAGGRSARFGGPKLEALYDGRPLLGWSIDAVARVADEIVVVVAPDRSVEVMAALGTSAARAAGAATASDPDGGPPSGSRLRVVGDRTPYPGPLAALATGLAATDRRFALVVAGDMPRLVPAVLRAMLDRLGARASLAAGMPRALPAEEPTSAGPSSADRPPDAVLLAAPPPLRVLPLALRREVATLAAESLVAGGSRSLRALVDGLRTLELPAAEWRTLDPAGTSLLDVDEPADLRAVRAAGQQEAAPDSAG
jgi:molybdopterin-guanine dinucleotide biosynthesis protein A